MLEIINHDYFIYGVGFGFFGIPSIILLFILFIEFCFNTCDYAKNRKEYKKWLEERKEMKD